MKIGVVGVGVVGGATEFSFRKLGHDVSVHDPKLGTELVAVRASEIAFLCVPTPSRPDGACDTSIVREATEGLLGLDYKGIIAIKSTVQPGTTEELITKHGDRICFVPEFLRERCAISDMVEHNNLLAVGTRNRAVYRSLVKAHGHYPRHRAMLTPTQAELLKYAHNSLNALRIIFANEFFEICKYFGEDYVPLKNSLLRTAGVKDLYLDCNETMRGFGGPCLPKDVAAMQHLVEAAGINSRLFEVILEQNAKLKKSVWVGMRE